MSRDRHHYGASPCIAHGMKGCVCEDAINVPVGRWSVAFLIQSVARASSGVLWLFVLGASQWRHACHTPHGRLCHSKLCPCFVLHGRRPCPCAATVRASCESPMPIRFAEPKGGSNRALLSLSQKPKPSRDRCLASLKLLPWGLCERFVACDACTEPLERTRREFALLSRKAVRIAISTLQEAPCADSVGARRPYAGGSKWRGRANMG